MAQIIIDANSSAELDASDKLRLLSVQTGNGLLQIGEITDEGYSLHIGGKMANVILPHGYSATIKSLSHPMTFSVGDFGGQSYGLASDQAVVSDGDTLEVDGGAVTLSVEDGVVSATFDADG